MTLLVDLIPKTLELSCHGHMVLDHAGKVVMWNHWMETAAGITAEKALGRTLDEVFDGGLPPRVKRAVDEAIKQRHCSVMSSSFTPHPFPLKHPFDENLLMTQKVTMKYFQHEGRCFCFIDVTDVSLAAHREVKLKRQTAEYAATLNKLSHVLDSVSEAIVGTDLDKRITTINPAAERLFGISHAQAYDFTLDQLLECTPEPRVDAVSRLESEIEFGLPGQRRRGFLNISVTQKSGHASQTWVIQDVTKAKESEAALLEAKRMAEQAAQQKADFLANMSHEIRTPMNGVLGMAELLANTALNDEQQEFLKAIRNSGAALLAIINDILDFSKIDADAIQLENLDFNLRHEFEDILEMFSAEAVEKDLALIYQLPHDMPLNLRGDPFRLRQVLVNLLSNGLKFTSRGAVILAVNQWSRDEDGVHMKIEVTDTGIGIEPDHLEKLFDPFTQADSSTTRRFGGTGLGLAICERLVSLMGGEINCHTTPGEGSTFWFTLTFPIGGIAVHAPPADGLDHLQCIIVSESPYGHQFLSYFCSYWNIKPLVFESMSAAFTHVDRLPGFTPDVLIMDIGGKAYTHQAAIANHPILGKAALITIAAPNDRPRRRRAADPRPFSGRIQLMKPPRFAEFHRALRGLATAGDSPQKRKPAPIMSAVDESASLHQLAPDILLVEDNRINQVVVTKMLHKIGCKPKLAVNGLEALKALASETFHLILMDCQMPEMDGYEATRAIRRDELDTDRHIPIVALTANALKGDRELCLESGMDDYLSKPVKIIQLQETLEKWLCNDGGH